MTIDEVLKDIHAIHEPLQMFEEKYKLISSDFYNLYKKNKLEESHDFVEWLGFYEILLDRKHEYRKLLLVKYDIIWPSTISIQTCFIFYVHDEKHITNLSTTSDTASFGGYIF